ncbi:MAG: GatB/YqeY domain-containing protein [Candidatus Accumulibacter sp.]|uniref:GatB/YqeY domain-containing protein n=1 Tax=Accumulibacter sp. TaxID=2053492 RepID=UPI0019FFB5E5|nr:GatB/YqeY domain-containing protein [Accumulibacter sp.]MBE2260905.1 GatB/YqeY domain-containing protein [Paracoccaceae bacterium]MCB1941456.1 GatB/YqeY domain-containing protein [Accumulibacter sp.]MCP5249380.1 GatB/YqeY domain-containing protein [Accumulibacter sp.]
MNLKTRINEDVKSAMRARSTKVLGTLRLLLAAIKQREVDERVELDDDALIAVINKMLKQRRDSIAQFAAAGRNDLADAERFEADLLTAYLPAALSPEEIATAVAAAITELAATGPADIGRVMNTLRPRLAGRADMGEVSRLAKTRLAGA